MLVIERVRMDRYGENWVIVLRYEGIDNVWVEFLDLVLEEGLDQYVCAVVRSAPNGTTACAHELRVGAIRNIEEAYWEPDLGTKGVMDLIRASLIEDPLAVETISIDQ